MGKTVAVASKFTEEENERIETYAELHGMSKSQVVHDLVLKGMSESFSEEGSKEDVGFKFKENYAYFWEGRTYRGILTDDGLALIRFGGELKKYPVNELPVEIVE